MIDKDICYRGTEGTIVSIKEQKEFSEYKECPKCGGIKFLMGLGFGDIGTTVWVICHQCGWKRNITDYDTW